MAPYATLQADLMGAYHRYSFLDDSGLNVRSSSGVEQKCCALQHWVFLWTSGNLLFTWLEGEARSRTCDITDLW